MEPAAPASPAPAAPPERKRRGRALRWTAIGTAVSLFLCLAGVAVVDVATTIPVSATWWAFAIAVGLSLGLGLAPLVAFAQDDGEENDRVREQYEGRDPL